MRKAIAILCAAGLLAGATACATLGETLETAARVVGKVGEVAPGLIRGAAGVIKAAEAEGKGAVDAIKSAVTGDSGE
jgi:hypothetical protein